MKVSYKNRRIQKLCTDRIEALRKYGEESADGIARCINTLEIYDFSEILGNHFCGFHALSGNRKCQYAMRVSKKNRLITIILDEEQEAVRVEEIVDYH